MAISTSLALRGFTGAIGDLIFRTYNGKTVVSMRPVYKNETNTEPRRKARGRFRDATDFASHAMYDKKQKSYYTQKAKQLKLPNAYTAAITDYLRKAKATAITRSSFSAQRNSVITIKIAKGVFKINKIKAQLHNADGKLLSEQDLERGSEQKFFEFRLTDNFPDYASLTIITDEPLPQTYIIPASEFMVLPDLYVPPRLY